MNNFNYSKITVSLDAHNLGNQDSQDSTPDIDNSEDEVIQNADETFVNYECDDLVLAGALRNAIQACLKSLDCHVDLFPQREMDDVDHDIETPSKPAANIQTNSMSDSSPTLDNSVAFQSQFKDAEDFNEQITDAEASVEDLSTVSISSDNTCYSTTSDEIEITNKFDRLHVE